MDYRRFGQTIALRVQRGEDILEAIKTMAIKEDIRLGSVTGIGACDYVRLGFFQLKTQEYTETLFEEDLELTSIVGNITCKDGAYYGHFHGNFAKADSSVIGGHLVEARVSVTGEIMIQVIDGQVERQMDSETGVNLFKFY